MKNLLLLVLFITLVSCERKSGKRQPIPTNVERIKVVIQRDGTYVAKENLYYYKIKILKDTTSAYLTSRYQYEKGDTVMVTPLNLKR